MILSTFSYAYLLSVFFAGVKCLIRSFSFLKVELFICIWFLRVFKNVFWVQVLYQMNALQKYFPQSIPCLFTILIVSFKEQKFFILMMLITFSFYGLLLLAVSKKSLLNPTFSSQSFIVLGFTFVK